MKDGAASLGRIGVTPGEILGLHSRFVHQTGKESFTDPPTMV
jgi:hypothetical protein